MSEHHCAKGVVRFKHQFKLHDVNSCAKTNIIVCRVAFSLCYGISNYLLDRCSSAMKESADRRLSSISMRSFKDDTLLDFTYLEAQEVFESNVVADDEAKLVLSHGKPLFILT